MSIHLGKKKLNQIQASDKFQRDLIYHKIKNRRKYIIKIAAPYVDGETSVRKTPEKKKTRKENMGTSNCIKMSHCWYQKVLRKIKMLTTN